MTVPSRPRLSRRATMAGLGATLIVRPAMATEDEPRELRLYQAHTGESFRDVYHDGGTPIQLANERLNWFLRDHHTDVATYMDTRLFDMLWRLQNEYRRVHGRVVTINIHSAYRTEQTNQMLLSEGAAPNSYHKAGRAVDVTVQGLGIYFLADRVQNIGAGGIGIYWRSRFAHIDSGPPRRWYQRV